MTIKSWKEDAYKIPAIEAIGSELEAARHCLTKWSWMLPEKLDQHGLSKVSNEGMLVDEYSNSGDRVVDVGSQNCALCCYHKIDFKIECEECIITKVNGVACDDQSVYNIWMLQDDPEPMIKTLEKCIKILEAEESILVEKSRK